MSDLIGFLVSRGIVSFLTMDAAVQRMREQGGRLGTSLLEVDPSLEPRQLTDLIAEFAGLQPGHDELLVQADADLAQMWSDVRARRMSAMPIRLEGNRIDMAVLEPLTELELAELNEEFGCVIVQYSVLEFRFFQLLHRFYDTDGDERFLSLGARFPLRAQPAAARPAPEAEPGVAISGRAQTAEIERTTGTNETLATSPQEPVAEEEAPGESRKREDTTSPQENLNDASTTSPQESVREDSTSPQESVREDSTSPQESVREDSTSPQESVREDSTSPQESVREDSTSPQESVREDTTSSNEPVDTETTTEPQQRAPTVASSERREPSLPSISVSPAAGVYASSTSRTDDSGARLFAAALAPGRRDSTADFRPTSAQGEEGEIGEGWSLEQLSGFYQRSQDRDAMLHATLGYLSRIFRRRFFLSFGAQRVHGFAAGGIEGDHVPCDQIEIPFDDDSTLQRIKEGVTYFHGAPDEVGLLTLYTRMRVPAASDLVVVPLRLGNTAIMILAGDNGPGGEVSEKELPHLFSVFNRLALSLEQLIERNRLIAAGRLADITPTGIQPLELEASDEEDDEWEQSPGDLLETSSSGNQPARQRQMRQHKADENEDPHEFDFAELARDLVGEEGSQTVNVAAAFREALALSARRDEDAKRQAAERSAAKADSPSVAEPPSAEELANIWDDLEEGAPAIERDEELGDAAARELQEESTWFLLDQYGKRKEGDEGDDEPAQTTPERPAPSPEEPAQTTPERPAPSPEEPAQTTPERPAPSLDEPAQTTPERPAPSLDEPAQTTPERPAKPKRSPTMAWRSKDLDEIGDALRTRDSARHSEKTPVSGLIAAKAEGEASQDTADDAQKEDNAASLPEAGKSAFERWLAQRNAYRKRGGEGVESSAQTTPESPAENREERAQTTPERPAPGPEERAQTTPERPASVSTGVAKATPAKKLTEPTRIARSKPQGEEAQEPSAAKSGDRARSKEELSLAERLRRGRTQSHGAVPGPLADLKRRKGAEGEVPPPPPARSSDSRPISDAAPTLSEPEDFDIDSWDPTFASEDSGRRFVERERAAIAAEEASANDDVPPPPPAPQRPTTLSGRGAPSRVPGTAVTSEVSQRKEDSGLQPLSGTMSMSRLPANVEESADDASEAVSPAAIATSAEVAEAPQREDEAAVASAPSSSQVTEISTLVKLDDLSEDQRRTHTQAHGVVSASLEALLFEDEALTADAIADLVGRSARQMPSIVASFPGPLRLDRSKPQEDTRPVREHGPLLSVVSSRLEAFVPQLWSCLERKNPEARYYALRLLAYLRELELRYSLIESAFDEDNQVRRLALHLLNRHRSSPDFSLALDAVRHRLSSDDRAQQEAAIVAVTRLRDFTSIPQLIDVVEHGDDSLATRATQALQRLTCEEIGEDAARWMSWWQEHEHEPPEVWIANAMTSESVVRRELAEKALRNVTGLTINFHARISERGRRRARRTFERHFRLV